MAKRLKQPNQSGFTLIEIMVALTIFSVVMVISMGSILAVFDANKKSQSLRAVMDNLNFTMEGMTRTIRFGTNYHCGSAGDTSSPVDCPSGDTYLTVKAADTSKVTYKLVNGRIIRSINGGSDYFLTSPDVTIQNLSFRVFGSQPYSSGTDLFQPQVIIVLSGYAGNLNSQSSFFLQTTVSQMQFDFQ